MDAALNVAVRTPALGRLLLTKLDHVGGQVVRAARAVSPAQQRWSNIPALPAVRDHGHCLSVVASEHADHDLMAFWLKRYPIPDLELEHPAVRMHLVQQPETLDNPVVQIDEFCLGELIDVDPYSLPW